MDCGWKSIPGRRPEDGVYLESQGEAKRPAPGPGELGGKGGGRWEK